MPEFGLLSRHHVRQIVLGEHVSIGLTTYTNVEVGNGRMVSCKSLPEIYRNHDQSSRFSQSGNRSLRRLYIVNVRSWRYSVA
ncbi:hypothetical protein AGR9A_Lc50108 [Agrobacterium salinitolerans str. Hayward 0363]|nr:hypothetical protein AGR9A_Lc50108 [Agrobacterium salinitolerans str. Hayward 0363]